MKYKLKNFNPFFPTDYEYSMTDFYAACPYSREQLMTKTRLRDVTQWRQIMAFYLWANEKSMTKVGKILELDHASIIHYIKNVQNALHGMDMILLDKINKVLKTRIKQSNNVNDLNTKEVISLRILEQKIKEKL